MSQNSRVDRLEQVAPAPAPVPAPGEVDEAEQARRFAENMVAERARLIDAGYLLETPDGLALADGLPIDHDRSMAIIILAMAEVRT